jgi:AcrR family transcriptional regulator
MARTASDEDGWIGMTAQTVRKLDRIPRRRVDKFEERRAELAQAAIQTLAELGYARTSLRDIAENSAFTHGVLHYYFTDKVDLILCSVRQYKARCVTRYDQAIAEAQTGEALVESFLERLGETLRDEADLHRLWYDIRAQAFFEAAFRADVAEIDKSLEDMIGRIVDRLAKLTGVPTPLPIPLLYAMIDGIFQQSLLKHISGDARAVEQLKSDVRLMLSKLAGRVIQDGVLQPRDIPA